MILDVDVLVDFGFFGSKESFCFSELTRPWLHELKTSVADYFLFVMTKDFLAFLIKV